MDTAKFSQRKHYANLLHSEDVLLLSHAVVKTFSELHSDQQQSEPQWWEKRSLFFLAKEVGEELNFLISNSFPTYVVCLLVLFQVSQHFADLQEL